MEWPGESCILHCGLFSDDFHENALFSPPVKLTIENLLPWPEVEPSAGNGNYDFPAHDLSFHMGICVILSRLVVAVSRYWLMGSKLFQPGLIVCVQPGFVIVNKNGCRNMHRIDKNQTLQNSTLLQALANLGCDVQQGTTSGNVEPEFLAIALHKGRSAKFEVRMEARQVSMLVN